MTRGAGTRLAFTYLVLFKWEGANAWIREEYGRVLCGVAANTRTRLRVTSGEAPSPASKPEREEHPLVGGDTSAEGAEGEDNFLLPGSPSRRVEGAPIVPPL